VGKPVFKIDFLNFKLLKVQCVYFNWSSGCIVVDTLCNHLMLSAMSVHVLLSKLKTAENFEFKGSLNMVSWGYVFLYVFLTVSNLTVFSCTMSRRF